MLQHLTGRVCPPLPLPRPAATAVIDWQGRRVHWTSHGDWQRGSAVVQGHAPLGFGLSDVATTGHPLVTATVLAGCSDQGHDFLTAAYVITYARRFGRYTHLLHADKGCVLYIGLQIFTRWQKSKVGVRIIFDGLDWIVQCLTSPPTQYRLYGRRFLQVKRPIQQYQSTEGSYKRQIKQRKQHKHTCRDNNAHT